MLCEGLTTLQNKPCTAHAREGSNFCFFHDPDVSQEEKRSVQSKGGQGNKRVGVVEEDTKLQPIALREVSDVLALLEMTTNELRSGRIDTKISNGIGYLAGHAMKAMELCELEKRIQILEQSMLKS